MTSKERITAALSHIQPDRTPIFEYVLLSPIADAILGRKYYNYDETKGNWNERVKEIGWEKAVKNHAHDKIEIALKLGHDLIYATPNPLPPDTSSQNKNENKIIIEYDENDPVEVIKARNIKRKYNIENNELSDLYFQVYYFLQKEIEDRGLELDLFAPSYSHGVWTDTDLMETMILDPEVAHEHFKLCTIDSLRRIEKYMKLSIRHIGVGGDFAGKRPIISPQSYREYIAPEIRILSDYIHNFGAWAINTSDGNLWDVIDDFLIYTNVDGYMEIDMSAGMDLKKLKELYGDRITFYGNIDCGTVLSFASVEEIERYTIECIEAGMGNGGHIFTASNAITSTVPLSNYIAMNNAYRKYFGLPEFKCEALSY